MSARTATAAVLVALLGLVCGAPSASAAPPELFWQTPEDGVAGGEAGRFSAPGDIATDPDSGHLFVADRGNARIVELSAWGEFVKAWGWGVVASGPGDEPAQNERQQLTVDASSGTYRLRYFNVSGGGASNRQTTVPISYNWPATDPGTPGSIDSVQEALEDLASLKAAPGSVTVSGGPGSPGGASPYEIEFTGLYADRDIPPLRVVESTLGGSAALQTLQEGGSFEVCVPADGDICQAGQRGGNKPGEMPELSGGIALDQTGDVYVFEPLYDETEEGANFRGEGPSFRVQKYSPEGEFQLMWGGEVNKTTGADICTKADVEAGEECGTGVPGTAGGEFTETFARGNKIAVGPTGSIFVGDVERIQSFSDAGVFEGELEVAETIQSMAMDGSGNFYAAFLEPAFVVSPKKDIRKLVPTGGGVTETQKFASSSPRAVTLDGSGNVYIIDRKSGDTGEQAKVIAYEADGTPLIEFDDHLAESGNPLLGLATGEACGIPGVDLYVSDGGGFLSAYGPAPTDLEACPPPLEPPAVSAPYATAVGTDSATLRARINPRFWADTRYYVQYGTAECEGGGCEKSKPAPPGTLLTTQTTKQPLLSEAVLLSGLQPGTTYHYRFVAQSGGGGPAFSPEASFTTWPAPTGETDTCPNAALRTGSSAALPDCRAYEMVSPVDKEGGDIFVLQQPNSGGPMSLDQSTPAGDRLSYSSYRAFGDAISAPISSTYTASRNSEGWGSEATSAPRGRHTWPVSQSLDVELKALTPDLCTGWLISDSNPPLTSDAPPGYANVYRREGCGSEGTYEALIPDPPDSIDPLDFRPEFQGISDDGATAIFRVKDKLSEDASACATPGVTGTCTFQLYEARPGGALRAVCILPGGGSPPAGCSAGTANDDQDKGRTHSVDNAISADGSRIFWSDNSGKAGQIYLRIEGVITVPVSEEGEALSGLSGEGAQYWTAAADGSEAIFSVGRLAGGSADLYRYRVASGETEQIAGKLYGLLGASEDAQTIYLVSGEALDEGAGEGQPNLYRYEAGAGFTYVGTLSGLDAKAGTADAFVSYSPVNIVPKSHTAQVSADGSHVAFMSSAPLTGYDNTDAISGQADAEVYLYDAEEGELRCVSCNPTGARPSGRDIGIWAAAKIPTSQTQLYQTPDVLSADGNRLYFESFEALEGADTNGKQDVYQWEAAGEGSCKQSSASYNPDAEGCVDLISSGQSKQDASIHAVSASGNDVFIATAAGLVPQDPGLVDIYDARANGGFPAPAAPRPPCEGEACQSPPAPPALLAPASQGFRGPGNLSGSSGGCATQAHRARRTAAQAKRLRRVARRAKAPAKAKRLHRAAKRRGKRARRLSRAARRCRAARKARR